MEIIWLNCNNLNTITINPFTTDPVKASQFAILV